MRTCTDDHMGMLPSVATTAFLQDPTEPDAACRIHPHSTRKQLLMIAAPRPVKPSHTPSFVSVFPK